MNSSGQMGPRIPPSAGDIGHIWPASSQAASMKALDPSNPIIGLPSQCTIKGPSRILRRISSPMATEVLLSVHLCLSDEHSEEFVPPSYNRCKTCPHEAKVIDRPGPCSAGPPGPYIPCPPHGKVCRQAGGGEGSTFYFISCITVVVAHGALGPHSQTPALKQAWNGVWCLNSGICRRLTI